MYFFFGAVVLLFLFFFFFFASYFLMDFFSFPRSLGAVYSIAMIVLATLEITCILNLI